MKPERTGHNEKERDKTINNGIKRKITRQNKKEQDNRKNQDNMRKSRANVSAQGKTRKGWKNNEEDKT